jgi:hypothetical protein
MGGETKVISKMSMDISNNGPKCEENLHGISNINSKAEGITCHPVVEI